LSIYIAITTLEDPDIVGTVSTALLNADRPDDVHIGVAAAVGDSFFEKISSLLKFNQLTLHQFDQSMANGIGMARNLSRFAYDDEEYILQVDSHTYFKKGWDTILTKMFNDAVEITGNKKTLLTASLGGHEIIDGVAVISDDEAKYCVITSATWSPYTNINHWLLVPLSKFPSHVKIGDKKIIPANKVNGNFIFSNKHFVEYSGLPDSSVYFDEEIIQTINMLENGFALAHPNAKLPITHRYKRDGEPIPRQDGKDLFWNDSRLHDCAMTASMFDFIFSNEDACKRYFKYSKHDIISKMVRPFYIPESFSY
jgi:hypothetical protein